LDASRIGGGTDLIMRLAGNVLQTRTQPGGADYAAYQKAYVLDLEASPPAIRTCRVGDSFGNVVVGEDILATVNVGVWEGHLTCTLVERHPLPPLSDKHSS